LHQIPKLSRTYILFKDFPGPGKPEKNFSRTCGHPAHNNASIPALLFYRPYALPAAQSTT